ncbi:MAG TPA: ATP-grasp domain-containing protein [Pseudolabrys sp.]|nr:ATP-grasp domain-containing protein [Pseudolabrys sp.]
MSESVPGALVVGGAHVSIAVARSLGRRGIPVWLLANHPLPTYSRYVKRSIFWPDAGQPGDLSPIINVARQHNLQGWVLMATGDQEMELIARNRDVLSQYFRIVTADWSTVQWVYDKRLTYSRAARVGIDYPESFEPRSMREIEALACRFPVILKPATRGGEDAFTRAKAWKAETREQLATLYRRAAALVGGDAIIVQEWIPGAGEAQFSYAALCERGEPLASLTARRTRQHPIDFGRSSTFVETIEMDEVEALARRFLKSIAYTGVAEVEFKRDRRDGRFKLLDVNGRFWTWCGLGDLAGVDFPYLAYRQSLRQNVAPVRAKAGLAWVHGSRDIVAAAEEFMRGTLTVGGYLRAFRQPLTFATFAWDDPLPALVELPVAAWNRVALKLGGSTRASAARKIARRRLAE